MPARGGLCRFSRWNVTLSRTVAVGNKGMKDARRMLGSVPDSVVRRDTCSILILATTCPTGPAGHGARPDRSAKNAAPALSAGGGERRRIHP
jgi:hypothetical protein